MRKLLLIMTMCVVCLVGCKQGLLNDPMSYENTTVTFVDNPVPYETGIYHISISGEKIGRKNDVELLFIRNSRDMIILLPKEENTDD